MNESKKEWVDTVHSLYFLLRILNRVLLCIYMYVYSWSEAVKVVLVSSVYENGFLEHFGLFSVQNAGKTREGKAVRAPTAHHRATGETQEEPELCKNNLHLSLHAFTFQYSTCILLIMGERQEDFIRRYSMLIGVKRHIDEKIKICDIHISISIEMH